MQPLLFEIESLESMRERFERALEKEYSTEFTKKFPNESPAYLRENVFDGELDSCYFRMIVVREDTPIGKFLHIRISSPGRLADLTFLVGVLTNVWGGKGIENARVLDLLNSFYTSSGGNEIFHAIFDVDHEREPAT